MLTQKTRVFTKKDQRAAVCYVYLISWGSTKCSSEDPLGFCSELEWKYLVLELRDDLGLMAFA